MHRIGFKRFCESRILAASDKTGKVWEVMVIKAGLSHNSTPPLIFQDGEWVPSPDENLGKTYRYYYSAEMLKAAMPLFDGKPAYAFEFRPNQFGHVDSGSTAEYVKYGLGLAKSKIGQYSNPRWGKDDEGNEGIIETLTLVDEELAGRLVEAWKAGLRDFVEYSIDGDGDLKIVSIAGQEVADVTIKELDSIDMVTAGAAGGKNLRLVAAKQPNEEGSMNAKLRALIFRLLESRKVDAARSNRILEADDKSAPKVAAEELQKEADAMQQAGGMEKAVVLAKEAIAALQSGNADAALAALQKLLDMNGAQAADAVKAAEEAKKIAEAEKAAAAAKADSAKAADANRGQPPGASVEDVKALQTEVEKLKEELDQEAAIKEIEAANLHATAKEHLKESVRGRTLSRARIREAISAEQKYLDILGVGNVGGIKFGPSGKDHASLALEGMFYNENRKDADGKVVKRFTSLREAKIQGWGGRHDEHPDEFLGSLHAKSRILSRLQEMTTSDFGEVFASTLHRVMSAEYALAEYNDWRKIVTILSVKDFRDTNYIRVGWYGDLPYVDPDGGTFQELPDLTDEQVAVNATQYGGLVSITRKMIVDDDINMIRLIPFKIARAAKLSINKAVFAMFTANSGAGATCSYDNVTLIHASSHLNGATSGGTALSIVAMNACRNLMLTQKAYGSDSTDPEYLGELNLPRWLIIPPELEAMAMNLCQNQFIVENASSSGAYAASPTQILPQSGFLNVHSKNNLDYIIVPSWTDADNWYAVADPRKVPALGVAFLNGQEEPEIEQEAINTGSNFSARKLTYRISHDKGVKALDHRGVYGQVV